VTKNWWRAEIIRELAAAGDGSGDGCRAHEVALLRSRGRIGSPIFGTVPVANRMRGISPAFVSDPVGGAVLQLDRLPKLGPNGNASFQTRCKQTLSVGVALSLGRDDIRAR
jgi:hypothetical protein